MFHLLQVRTSLGSDAAAGCAEQASALLPALLPGLPAELVLAVTGLWAVIGLSGMARCVEGRGCADIRQVEGSEVSLHPKTHTACAVLSWSLGPVIAAAGLCCRACVRLPRPEVILARGLVTLTPADRV